MLEGIGSGVPEDKRYARVTQGTQRKYQASCGVGVYNLRKTGVGGSKQCLKVLEVGYRRTKCMPE